MHAVLSRASFDAEIQGLTPELCGLRGWTLHEANYPALVVDFMRPQRPTLRVIMDFAGFPATPPSITLANDNGVALTEAPKAPGGQFHQGPHTRTGRPFVCMRGSREYHTHDSHVGDVWDNYRGRPEFSLGGIVTQVWNAWLKVPA
jgi:hypothetical protein